MLDAGILSSMSGTLKRLKKLENPCNNVAGIDIYLAHMQQC
jgi:hypothetical protein